MNCSLQSFLNCNLQKIQKKHWAEFVAHPEATSIRQIRKIMNRVQEQGQSWAAQRCDLQYLTTNLQRQSADGRHMI
jgi:hypothetical protein